MAGFCMIVPKSPFSLTTRNNSYTLNTTTAVVLWHFQTSKGSVIFL